jgi:hypothetical protein
VRLAGHTRPGGVQSRRLAKGSLVLKNNYRLFATSFFLRRG